MKHLALTLSIAFFVVAATDAAPVIFIVRHAEKATTGGNDPDLSVAGQKRAEALARILKDSQITCGFRYGIQTHTGNRGANGESGAR